MKKVIVIVGPTAIGKTALSLELANQFSAEIISGDSMQVYEGMDIGTGKVLEVEKQGIPHYMLDIIQPHDAFSVATYQQKVKEYIDIIHHKGKIPIIVGGSGLYIQAVLFGYAFSERKRDEGITKVLEDRLQREGNEVLYKELTLIDPIQAKSIHPNNYRRVIRALEIYQTTGLTMSETHQNQNHDPCYDHYMVGLEMDRSALYDNINRRVDHMLESGLVEEVGHLYQKGYGDTQAMKAIGYKEIIPYIKGETTLDEAVFLLKRNSRRYAKRQYTWFKNKMDIHWYQMDEDVAQQSTMHIIQDCHYFLEHASHV